MNTVIIWTTIVLIIPEQNNIYWNKSWRLGLIPTRNTITLYLFSMRIIPYSFASYLGHCSSCIGFFSVWHFIPTNTVSNTQEPHCLTSNEYIHNMYIIYIPELDISSLFFSTNIIFQILFQQFFYFLEESINITSGAFHMTHNPKCVSQILIFLDSHFDIDHHHQMFGVLPNSIL